jgi:hypothetical protein
LAKAVRGFVVFGSKDLEATQTDLGETGTEKARPSRKVQIGAADLDPPQHAGCV